jgi:hypothetical protein
MAPDAHGAQVLPDPDFGPKKKKENRKNFGQLFN